MYKALSFFTTVLFIMSCNQAPKKEETEMGGPHVTAPVDSLVKSVHAASPKDSGDLEKENNFKLENYMVYSYPPDDYITVNKTCVVVIYPTGDQSAKMQKHMGEEDYSTTADDYAFYQSQYIEAANKRKIETVSPDKRYIKFVGDKKMVVLDRCAKVSGGWMVILFRPDSLPRISGDVEADTAFVHYFGK